MSSDRPDAYEGSTWEAGAVPEDSRTVRRAQRAARMRRRRIRRLTVTATALAVLAAAGVVVLRSTTEAAPQVSGEATATAGTSTSAATSAAGPRPQTSASTVRRTQDSDGAAASTEASAKPEPTPAEPQVRPRQTRASRDQAPAERTPRRARQALPAAKLPIISEGDYGTVIAAAQRALDVEPTGYFGPKTHRAVVEYQESIGLPTTGQVATFTWAALGAKTVRIALKAAGTPDGFTEGEPTDIQESADPRPTSSTVTAGEAPVLQQSDSGEAVAVLQRALGVKPATGFFGPKTAAAVRSFQSDNGLPTTGMVATYTWTALGDRVARQAAAAHAEFGTAFGPGAPDAGGSGGGNGNSGGQSGSTPSSQGLFCPVADFTYGDGLGAPRPGGRTHAGLDLMGSRGEPVYSIGAGTVTRSGYQSNGGLILDITGSKGMYFYGHFDSIVVGYGDRVAAGQLIGYMGDTGSPGAVHLHLEVRPHGWSGGYNDPTPLIRALCG